MNEMAVSQSQAELWTLLADRRTVRFNIPPVPLWGHGLTQPVTLHLDLDAASVDETIERLTMLRSQMLPAPQRN